MDRHTTLNMRRTTESRRFTLAVDTLKVGPDDATLLFGTRDSVLMVHTRCPRVLQVFPTMPGSSQVPHLSQSQLSNIVGSTCNTLGQRGTMLHVDTVPCPKEQSCIVWTYLYWPRASIRVTIYFLLWELSTNFIGWVPIKFRGKLIFISKRNMLYWIYLQVKDRRIQILPNETDINTNKLDRYRYWQRKIERNKKLATNLWILVFFVDWKQHLFVVRSVFENFFKSIFSWIALNWKVKPDLLTVQKSYEKQFRK